MKQILMALTIIGLFHLDAQAQSRKGSAQNYAVCRYGDTYAVCGDVPAPSYVATPEVSFRNTSGDEYVEVKDEAAKNVTEDQYRTRHNIRVYDDLHGNMPAYTGSPEKAEYRNMNVNQTSIILPPNTGSIK